MGIKPLPFAKYILPEISPAPGPGDVRKIRNTHQLTGCVEFVFVVLAHKPVEVPQLAEHGADAAHLNHQPLDCLVAAGPVLGQELSGLVHRLVHFAARFFQTPPRGDALALR